VVAFGDAGLLGGWFRVVFVHSTKTDEEQQHDLYECKRDSASAIYPIPGESRTDLALRQRALTRECMSVRGYSER
jgi:hypothetical protein